jgi:hypothetical protein
MVLERRLFNSLEVADISALLTMENLPVGMVAVLLNVSRLTLAQWRKRGEGPPFRLVKGGGVAYPRASFEVYLRAARQTEVRIPAPKPSKQFRRILSCGGLHDEG